MSLATATVAISNNTSLGVRSVTIPDNKSWLITGYTTSAAFTLSYPSSTGPYSVSPAGLLNTSPGGYVMLPSGTEIRAASNSVAIFSIVEIDSVEADVPVPAPTPTPAPNPTDVVIDNIVNSTIDYGGRAAFSIDVQCINGLGRNLYIQAGSLNSGQALTVTHEGTTYSVRNNGLTTYQGVYSYVYNLPSEILNTTSKINISVDLTSTQQNSSAGTYYPRIEGTYIVSAMDSSGEFNRESWTIPTAPRNVAFPEYTLEWDGALTTGNITVPFESPTGISWVSWSRNNSTVDQTTAYEFDYSWSSTDSGSIDIDISPNASRGIPALSSSLYVPLFVRFNGVSYPVDFGQNIDVQNRS